MKMDGGAGLVDGAGQLAERVGHQAGVPADLRFAHRAFEFGLGDKGGHGVDDHEVHRAGTDQHVGDFKGLLSVVGLRDEQFVGFDAKAPGIGHVKRVLGVDEGRRSRRASGIPPMTCRVRVVLPEDSGRRFR